MIWNFDSPLGSCMPRGIPVRKCSAGAAIGAGLFGDILNLFGTAMTNSSNEYQTTQTNNYNREMFREQLAAQKQQWQDERAENRFLSDQDYERYLENREYETPVNQKNRLLQAGINPAFAMSSGQSFGSASVGSPHSSGSVPSSSVPNAPQAQSYQAIAPHFESGHIAAEAMLRNDALQADISSRRAQQDIEAFKVLSEARSRDFQNGKIKAEMDKILQDIQFNRKNETERSRAIGLANDKIRADQLYQEELTRGLKFANDVAPALNELEKRRLASEIANASAMTAELNSRTDLNSKQKELVQKQINEQCIKNAQLPKQLHNENAIRVATYKQIKKQSELVEAQTRTQQWYEMDAKKGYNSHTGNNRTLQDLIEIEMRRNPIKPK